MLDPTTVQVLFADLQPLIVARSKTNTPDALTRSAGVLARVARLLHLPMHLSVVPDGRQPAALIPELARETEGVAQYPRLSANPFVDEATRVAIVATSRQHLAIAGFPTEAVVLHAVRDALAAGSCLCASGCVWRHVVPYGGRGVPTDRGGWRGHDVRRRAGHGNGARFRHGPRPAGLRGSSLARASIPNSESGRR